MQTYSWVGSRGSYLDEVHVTAVGEMLHVGRFGGSTAGGAHKNEDGLFALGDEAGEWVLAVLVDAHHTAASAELLVGLFDRYAPQLADTCGRADAFAALEPAIVELLMGSEFRSACRGTTGETSCLICFVKGAYLWWLSVGDCMAYLLHPELAGLGQYALNQRQFYEWIGARSALDLPVPCYTSGRRQLRFGANAIVLTTDGILDTADRRYRDPAHLYEAFFPRRKVGGNAIRDSGMDRSIRTVLEDARRDRVRDSATMLGFYWTCESPGLMPSDV
ncbi:protein phosphatase 2C domain-containing protein [Paenibacillus sp. IB182496]|uniref:Protein phosphatase 2C domain-containing protein n=1 Tax=Paenibacillus sabuli TaxID=2772509 RepID=A0A927BQC8_9BACL|nr:protein phosphatase 2C domain-containing protein [Paenibacillus sabuli]MBD2843624.1 protein phosphatase 2C domain-containing protein [Paenibacillus sabuli]